MLVPLFFCLGSIRSLGPHCRLRSWRPAAVYLVTLGNPVTSPRCQGHHQLTALLRPQICYRLKRLEKAAQKAIMVLFCIIHSALVAVRTVLDKKTECYLKTAAWTTGQLRLPLRLQSREQLEGELCLRLVLSLHMPALFQSRHHYDVERPGVKKRSFHLIRDQVVYCSGHRLYFVWLMNVEEGGVKMWESKAVLLATFGV